MNVFVLCTGRSGSTGFIKACKHISNYTTGHESRTHCLGKERFAFPDNHIEADNRLSWQLGQLDKEFGNKAFYVHLKRDSKKAAESYMQRFLLPKSMIYAYANGIKKLPPETLNKDERHAICLDYIETVNFNINKFLNDKPHQITIELDEVKHGFRAFWKAIHAQGSLEQALKEFDLKHNKRPLNKFNLRYNIKHFFFKLKLYFEH